MAPGYTGSAAHASGVAICSLTNTPGPSGTSREDSSTLWERFERRHPVRGPSPFLAKATKVEACTATDKVVAPQDGVASRRAHAIEPPRRDASLGRSNSPAMAFQALTVHSPSLRTLLSAPSVDQLPGLQCPGFFHSVRRCHPTGAFAEVGREHPQTLRRSRPQSYSPSVEQTSLMTAAIGCGLQGRTCGPQPLSIPDVPALQGVFGTIGGRAADRSVARQSIGGARG